jgi:hypothetical protein
VRGSVLWKLNACPGKASREAWEILEAYENTLLFPGVPLTGTAVDDLDARVLRGLRAVRQEANLIESQIRSERVEALRREREARGGR